MEALLALAPIVTVVVLLLLRVAAVWAATAGFAVAVALASAVFTLTPPEAAEAALGTAPILGEVALILLGGVTLAESMARSGAQDRIAAWLAALEERAGRAPMLLLLVYGLTPFTESVTGFALGVVITAPLLLRLGLTPVRAVTTGLLGLVLVPWGSLAPGTLVASELGGVGFAQLGFWTAVFTLPVLMASGVGVLLIAFSRPTLRQILLTAAVLLLQWGALLGVSALLAPPLAGVLASAVVIVSVLLGVRLRSGALPAVPKPLRAALMPYAVLVSGILLSSGLISVTGQQSLALLSSPGLWVVLAGAISVRQLRGAAQRRQAAAATLRRWLPIAATTLLFMLLGFTMAATGMAEVLATAAAAMGPAFVGLIPLVGALGGFLTGSNTGAAAMFSAATSAAASGLGANPLVALAGQNAAGSFAMIASPPRIALAAGVVLAAGERPPSAVGRILLVAVLAAAVAIGGLTLTLA